MSEHKIELTWALESPAFTYKEYNREYELRFAGGLSLRASGAVEFLGKPDYPNPEDMFVASLSSCHMLTFLAVAAKRGFAVERYEDKAVGHLEKNAKGKLAMTRVELKPQVTFRDKQPDEEQLKRMHETSHHECFIANSVSTEVTVTSI